MKRRSSNHESIPQLRDYTLEFVEYVPAQQAGTEEELIEAGKWFLEANPTCPHTLKFLIQEFTKKL